MTKTSPSTPGMRGAKRAAVVISSFAVETHKEDNRQKFCFFLGSAKNFRLCSLLSALCHVPLKYSQALTRSFRVLPPTSQMNTFGSSEPPIISRPSSLNQKRKNVERKKHHTRRLRQCVCVCVCVFCS